MRGVMTAAFFAALIAGGYHFYTTRQNELARRPPAAHLAVFWDVSPSMKQSCSALAATVEGALKGMNVRKGSKFVLVTSGDGSSANFPVLKLDTELPAQTAGPYAAGKTREEFLRELGAVCAAFKQTDSSPIFGGVNVALEQLQSLGCDARTNCRVVAVTDLLESVSKPVIDRIRSKSEPGTFTPLASNDTVDLYLCGYASVTELAAAHGIDIERVKRVWLGLYTRTPHIQPFCPGMSEAQAAGITQAHITTAKRS